MTWYTFLLFVHVTMAVTWVGGGLMMQLFGIRAAMSGDPRRLATLGEDIEWIANRVFIPASLLAFLSGILLVIESDFYGFGDVTPKYTERMAKRESRATTYGLRPKPLSA